jgi:hypothetical protein
MLIQKLDDYELQVSLTWLSPDELHLKISSVIMDPHTSTASTQNRSYFMRPEEAMRIADHINDVLCR